MRNCNWIWILLLLLSSCVQSEWSMVWNDEFEQDGAPDASKWIYVEAGKSDWNRFCVTEETTVAIESGKLCLRGVCADSIYKTGGVRSTGKFAFQYGKIEVRAKFEHAKGAWPAIWMMPEEAIYGGWPRSGEIDIMEHLNNDSIVYQTVHSEYVDMLQNKTNPPHHGTSSFVVGDFNVYGLEWYPDRLDFYINGLKTFSYPRVENAGSAQWPFDRAFHIILNMGVGGNWVGRVIDEELPVEMQVDWVRVYKKNSYE